MRFDSLKQQISYEKAIRRKKGTPQEKSMERQARVFHRLQSTFSAPGFAKLSPAQQLSVISKETMEFKRAFVALAEREAK